MTTETKVARGGKLCSICGKEIVKGERYTYSKGIRLGYPNAPHNFLKGFKAHGECFTRFRMGYLTWRKAEQALCHMVHYGKEVHPDGGEKVTTE